jgi:ParB-like chromosome segregation protein Spo0J
MSADPARWQPGRLSPAARRMAEAAARAAGLSLQQWLAGVIRAASAIERAAASAPVTAATAERALATLAETLRGGDLPPLDEARAYFRLVNELGLDAGAIARGVGRSAEHVTRALRLLTLPPGVRQLIERRALSAEHAYTLIDAEDPENLAQAALALGLAVDEMRRRARAERRKT